MRYFKETFESFFNKLIIVSNNLDFMRTIGMESWVQYFVFIYFHRSIHFHLEWYSSTLYYFNQ